MPETDTIWLPDSSYDIGVHLLAIKAQVAALDAEKEFHIARFVEQMKSFDGEELVNAMKALKLLKGTGWTKLLEDAGFEVTNIRVAERRILGRYNDGDGRWRGVWPLPESEPRPAPGTWVVYQLINDDDLVYIGSSGSLRTRLKAHEREKAFNSWKAAECDSEMHCRDLETALIDRYRPPLNRMIPTPRLELVP